MHWLKSELSLCMHIFNTLGLDEAENLRKSLDNYDNRLTGHRVSGLELTGLYETGLAIEFIAAVALTMYGNEYSSPQVYIHTTDNGIEVTSNRDDNGFNSNTTTKDAIKVIRYAKFEIYAKYCAFRSSNENSRFFTTPVYQVFKCKQERRY
uniref:Uncharacterized protein n=1 Tax=Glossina austeni TaxID=7395 RepID=A0A1A9VDX6_GLOAU